MAAAVAVAAVFRAAEVLSVTLRVVAEALAVVGDLAVVVEGRGLVMQVMELKLVLVTLQLELPKVTVMSAGLELKPAGGIAGCFEPCCRRDRAVRSAAGAPLQLACSGDGDHGPTASAARCGRDAADVRDVH